MARKRVATAAVAVAIAFLGAPRLAVADEEAPSLAPPGHAFGHDPRFAAALFREHDYFRAIGEYKALAFYASAADRPTFTFAIAEGYRRSDRPRSSIPVAARLLAHPDGAVRDRASLFLAANFYALRSRALAEPYLAAARRADPFLTASYQFLGAVDGGHLAVAQEHLKTAAAYAPAARKAQVAGWAATVAQVEDTSRRSPVLAGIFSAIVPGSGQFYAGHPVDGAQALLFVGALATATFASYRYEHDRQGPYPLTITTATLAGIFYAANIYGAVRSAGFYNKNAREARLAPLRQAVLDVPLWEPPAVTPEKPETPEPPEVPPR